MTIILQIGLYGKQEREQESMEFYLQSLKAALKEQDFWLFFVLLHGLIIWISISRRAGEQSNILFFWGCWHFLSLALNTASLGRRGKCWKKADHKFARDATDGSKGLEDIREEFLQGSSCIFRKEQERGKKNTRELTTKKGKQCHDII